MNWSRWGERSLVQSNATQSDKRRKPSQHLTEFGISCKKRCLEGAKNIYKLTTLFSLPVFSIWCENRVSNYTQVYKPHGTNSQAKQYSNRGTSISFLSPRPVYLLHHSFVYPTFTNVSCLHPSCSFSLNSSLAHLLSLSLPHWGTC